MGGISRINGQTIDTDGFYGYQPIFLKIAGTNVGTADTGGGNPSGTSSALVLGNYSKSIRAIQKIATIVYLGTKADNQFVIAVDGPTAQTYNTANSDTSLTAAIKKVIDTDVFAGVSTATVTDISALTTGQI
jgi:hypothetical protein